MSDLSILPVAIFVGMMAFVCMLAMLFVTLTDRDPVQD